MHKTTQEPLNNLARICNEFFEANSLQFTIKDLIWWVFGKPNPFYFPTLDRRKKKVSDGMIYIIKGFLKLYQVGPTGRMVLENQFTHDLWINTTYEQLSRLFGKHVSGPQYRLCKKALSAAGILRVRFFKNKRWGSEMQVQFDIRRLKEIITELPKLKKLFPSRDNWPLPSRADINVTCPILVENASSISRVDATPSLSERSTTGAVEEKKTSDDVGDSLLQEKPTIDFANEEFRGTLDQEGEMILAMIRQRFEEPVTCGMVRKLNYLRRRHSRIALNLARISQYFEFRQEHGTWPVLPEWMIKLPLEKLLSPGIWVTIVASLQRHAHPHAAEDVDELKDVETYEPVALETLEQVTNRPEEFWKEFILDTWDADKRWLAYAVYGFRKGWSNLLMDKIRTKAKAMLSDMPVFFMRTEHVFSWSRLLDLTEKEAAEIRQKGDNNLRAIQWRVYLAQQAGAI